MVMANGRARLRLGELWPAIADISSLLPFASVLAGKTRLRLDQPLVISMLASAALTAWLLLGGHAVLFGADPLALAAT
jgi:uncharacterized membrane protein